MVHAYTASNLRMQVHFQVTWIVLVYLWLFVYVDAFFYLLYVILAFKASNMLLYFHVLYVCLIKSAKMWILLFLC